MRVPTETLQSALSEILGSAIRGVVRKPCAYQSSYAIEEVEAQLDDGRSFSLVFKDLALENMLPGGRRLKPDFVYAPLREIRVYERILSQMDMGTAAFYGCVVDEQAGRYWLFIENVPGITLYQTGDMSTWENAAHWLAALHDRLSERTHQLGREVPLLTYTEDFCRKWMRRAETFFSDPGSISTDGIIRLGRQYEKVLERIVTLPVTFIHGEFYPSNILLDSRYPTRICPIDWEMAAVGPGALDLAALTSGQWTDEQRTSMVRAYISRRFHPNEVTSSEFIHHLDCCRLHLAIQWLGWFGRQKPYWQHAHDWLGEAFRLADRIA